MTDNSFTYAPDRRPAIHPSGRVVYLAYRLDEGPLHLRVTLHDPLARGAAAQRIFPGRDTAFVVQRACI